METSIVVQFVRQAGNFRAVIEQVQGLHLSPQQLAYLSVRGATLGDAYDNFKIATQRLQRQQALPRSTAIRFKYQVRQRRKASHSPQIQ